MAKYPYIVNKDGVWYPAGIEVPAGAFLSSEDTEAKKDKVYTKTDISRMPVAELKELASTMGIKSYETMNGAGLKKNLIEALGL